MTVIRQVCAKTVRMQALVDKFDEYEKKKSWNAVYIVSPCSITNRHLTRLVFRLSRMIQRPNSKSSV